MRTTNNKHSSLVTGAVHVPCVRFFLTINNHHVLSVSSVLENAKFHAWGPSCNLHSTLNGSHFCPHFVDQGTLSHLPETTYTYTHTFIHIHQNLVILMVRAFKFCLFIVKYLKQVRMDSTLGLMKNSVFM